MQCLYEWDFNGKKKSSVSEIIEKNIKEFGPGMDDNSFVNFLIFDIIFKWFLYLVLK